MSAFRLPASPQCEDFSSKTEKAAKVTGIVGGMGPEAGLFLFRRLLVNTGARLDQEHLPVILMSLPENIPDRTAFLEGRVSQNPAYVLVDVIRKLENAGAEVAGIACNTAYVPAIYDVILAELDKVKSRVKLLNMPAETCHLIRRNHSTVKKVGIMATNGTYKSGLYLSLLEEQGLQAVLPDEEIQTTFIHKMIYDPAFGIKANPTTISSQARRLMLRTLDYFAKRQADAVILGCSELSVMLQGKCEMGGLKIIDSIESLALAMIREAKAGLTLGPIGLGPGESQHMPALHQ